MNTQLTGEQKHVGQACTGMQETTMTGQTVIDVFDRNPPVISWVFSRVLPPYSVTVGLMTILHPKKHREVFKFLGDLRTRHIWTSPPHAFTVDSVQVKDLNNKFLRSRSTIKESFPKHPGWVWDLCHPKLMELATGGEGDSKKKMQINNFRFQASNFRCTSPPHGLYQHAAKVLTMVLLAWFCFGKRESRMDLTWNQELNNHETNCLHLKIQGFGRWVFSFWESLPAGTNGFYFRESSC